jgi:hypothetical protein
MEADCPENSQVVALVKGKPRAGSNAARGIQFLVYENVVRFNRLTPKCFVWC